MTQQSNSQHAGLSIAGRIAYLARLSFMHVQRFRSPDDFTGTGREIESYRKTFNDYTGRRLEDACILEVGFGQRPFRLIALQTIGLDARGIDLDTPIYNVSLDEFFAVVRRNGLLRAVKSFARRLVFDPVEYRSLSRFLKQRYGRDMVLDLKRLIVGDAAVSSTWKKAGGPFDLIISEDVLEHIPAESAPAVVELIATNMKSDGIAIVTPMVFTGICGGHDMGWYPHQVDLEGVSRGLAWGHLTGEGNPADTFLSRSTLADYRALFGRHFEIVSEERRLGDLGRRHLTEERRAELAEWSEDELFSNNVRFVLRKRHANPRPD